MGDVSLLGLPGPAARLLLLAGDGAKERSSITWSVLTTDEAKGWSCGSGGQKAMKEGESRDAYSGNRAGPF